MPEYIVTETIQSLDTTNPPALVHVYRGWELHKAMSALVGAAANTVWEAECTLPDAMRYKVTSVNMVVSECVWEHNQYQSWARVKCAGRVQEVAWLDMTALICGAHRDAWEATGRTYGDTTPVPTTTKVCAPCADGEHADDGTGSPCPCCKGHADPSHPNYTSGVIK